jgi:alpha-tubulin suppressor-like RCC1 family protein
LGDNNIRKSPTPISFFQQNSKIVIDFAAGTSFSYFLTSNGDLFGVGDGSTNGNL